MLLKASGTYICPCVTYYCCVRHVFVILEVMAAQVTARDFADPKSVAPFTFREVNQIAHFVLTHTIILDDAAVPPRTDLKSDISCKIWAP